MKGLLLFGDLGKLVKLAGGIMNTHSLNADCRMEILSANAVMAGADADTAWRIMRCVTTDEALDILNEAGIRDEVMSILLDRMMCHLGQRSGGRIELGIAVFSSRQGFLGMTDKVEELIGRIGEVVER